VCLIDPVGDVYACPFAIHDRFRAGNVRGDGGFGEVWRDSTLFRDLREPQSAGACASCGAYDACRGGCMAAKFFTGLPLEGPDPECVKGNAEPALAAVAAGSAPRPGADHSRPGTTTGSTTSASPAVPVTLRTTRPDRACDEHPLSGRGVH
jgi:radical SAM protein with 4Fe4S-binding SPASM domain